MAVAEKVRTKMEFSGAGVEVRRIYWYMFYAAGEISLDGRRGWVTSAVTGPSHNDLTLGWLIAKPEGDSNPATAVLAEAGRAGSTMYQIFHFPTKEHSPEVWVQQFTVVPDKEGQSEVPGASTVKGSIVVTDSLEEAQALVADIKAKASPRPAAKPKEE